MEQQPIDMNQIMQAQNMGIPQEGMSMIPPPAPQGMAQPLPAKAPISESELILKTLQARLQHLSKMEEMQNGINELV